MALWLKARGPSASWLPTDVNGLVGWWDASDTDTITESSGKVSQWDDKGPYGYDLSQGTSDNQPLTGSNSQNTLNLITFDGSNDLLSRTTTPTWAQYPTIIIVCSMGVGEEQWWTQANSAVAGIFGRALGGSDYQNLYVYGASGGFTYNFGTGAFPLTIVTAQWGASGAGLMRLNGTQVATGTATMNGTETGINLGRPSGGLSPNGDIAELIIYDSQISADDYANAEAYLNAKWAVY